MSDQDKSRLDQKLNQLASDTQVSGALEWLTKASIYEQFNVYKQAKESYESALQADPSNKSIKTAYGLFLARIGLVSEAEAVID
jgi:Tfp pilus assembly protein PilF